MVCVILKDSVITYDDSPKVRDAVFDKLIAWYFKHQSFEGKSIVQCDDPAMDAPNILADLADDIIKFDVKEYE